MNNRGRSSETVNAFRVIQYGEEDARERDGETAQGIEREHGTVADEDGGDMRAETAEH